MQKLIELYNWKVINIEEYKRDKMEWIELVVFEEGKEEEVSMTLKRR